MSMRSSFLGIVLLLVTPGCVEQSAVGFRLPAGDVGRGQVAFVELGCASCHTVAELDLPRPVADPPVGVDLAVVLRKRTDGELVTSIIHPSHKLATSWTGGTTEVSGASRMGDYGDAMSVRQLTDLVAFLKEHQHVQEAARSQF
jgi:mono/diheme cytochrome c family protein